MRVLVVSSVLLLPLVARAASPNLIFCLVDDWGYNDVGYHNVNFPHNPYPRAPAPARL